MGKVISFLFGLGVFGGGTIYFGFLSGHPVAGIAIAILVTLLVYLYSVYSQLSGAESALRNPPSPGKTKVVLRAFDQDIWESDEFEFSPALPDGEEKKFAIEIFSKDKGGRPKGSLSSENLTRGTKADDILPLLRELKDAKKNNDGSFSRLCRENGIPESTARYWLENYKI